MIVLILLAYIGVLVEARLIGPWPDLLLIFLLPLSLRLNVNILFPLALLYGILKDGINPNTPWVSPLFFLIAGFIGNFLKENVNLKLILPRLLYIFAFTLIYESFLFSINLAPIGFLIWKVILTTAIALPITYLVVR